MENWKNSGWRVGRPEKTPKRKKKRNRNGNKLTNEVPVNADITMTDATNTILRFEDRTEEYYLSLPDLVAPKVSDIIAYKVIEVSARWVFLLLFFFFY